jgi:hypothetical protein
MKRLLPALFLLAFCCDAGPARAQAPDKPAPPAVGKDDYRLHLVRLGNNRLAVLRYRVTTGETWALGDGNAYVKLAESGAVPPGNYDIVTAGAEAEYAAFRIDRRSGATWQLRNNKWVPVKEPKKESDSVRQTGPGR